MALSLLQTTGNSILLSWLMGGPFFPNGDVEIRHPREGGRELRQPLRRRVERRSDFESVEEDRDRNERDARRNRTLGTGGVWRSHHRHVTGFQPYQKHFTRNNFMAASSVTSAAPSMMDCAASMRSNGSRCPMRELPHHTGAITFEGFGAESKALLARQLPGTNASILLCTPGVPSRANAAMDIAVGPDPGGSWSASRLRTRRLALTCRHCCRQEHAQGQS